MMASTLGLVFLTFTLQGVFSAVLTIPQVSILCLYVPSGALDLLIQDWIMMACTLGLVFLTFTLQGVFSAVLTIPQVRILCLYLPAGGPRTSSLRAGS